jgi:capsular exopolysaccharide synthesis family protein
VTIYKDMIKWAEKRGEVLESPLEADETPDEAHHPLPGDLPRPLANDLQMLQENIEALRGQDEFRTVLVASAVRGEGASTIAANWCRLLARDRLSGMPISTTDTIGGGILLIDANLRRPVQHSLFDLDRKRGLTELLQGELDLQQVIKGVSRRNLWVITSGKPAANPADLLGSMLMRGILEECRRRFEFIVVDAAPVSLYAETLALAKQVDATLLVVRTGQTRWEVAASAKNQLQKVNSRILGVVLNQRKFIIPGWIYKRI